ncbi:MAG: FAD binding domain-containing protein [Rhodospirillales bacterium]|nr:FAD binding domain-containing protein [Rhodospirillales bacterium]
MKPAPFAYCDPQTLEEALELLARHGEEAKILAGGQTLGPLLNMRLAMPAVLIDINGIAALEHRRADTKGLAIGALTRQSALEDDADVGALQPLLALTLPQIAHRAIRNRGTVGGSLAHADPAAEWPAIATLLGAELIVQSRARGTRIIPVQEFFITHLTTALAADEILCEVRLPPSAPGSGYAVLEFARRHGDFALAGAMARLTRDAAGRLRDPRLVLFGVGKRPERASCAEAMLAGARPEAGLFAAAAQTAAGETDPYDDLHASARYRRHLAGVLAGRALEQAFARTGEDGHA